MSEERSMHWEHEKCVGFWLESLKESDQSEDLGVDKRVIS